MNNSFQFAKEGWVGMRYFAAKPDSLQTSLPGAKATVANSLNQSREQPETESQRRTQV